MATATETQQIEELLQVWGEEAGRYQDTIDELVEKLVSYKKEAAEILEEFDNSKNVSYVVAPRVLKELDLGHVMKAQKILHVASYKIQEVSSYFKLIFNVKAIEILNDINTVEQEIHTKFVTDGKVSHLLGSNASIERYYKRVAMRVLMLQNRASTLKRTIDMYSGYVEEQMFAMGRLDNLLKFSNSLDRAELMNRANRGVL